MRTLGYGFIVLALAMPAFGAVAAPEIDGNTAVAAIALVGGSLLVLRGRRK